MTIKITLSNAGTGGVNYNGLVNRFFSGFVSSGFPYQEEDDEMVMVSELDGANTEIIVLEGANYQYEMSSHTVSGRLDTLTLGTLGDSYNADGSFDLDAEGHITNYDATVTYEGLDVSNAYGVRGDLHELVAEFLYLGSTTDRGLDTFNAVIAGEAQRVWMTEGNDRYAGTEYNDTVDGGQGNDELYGNGGNDKLVGRVGNDNLVGGDGNDRILGGPGNDRIQGGDGHDRLFGDDGNDQIFGNQGNDRLVGGEGNDILLGGLGNDTINGGPGEDQIRYRSADEADGDYIVGFETGTDVISLRRVDANTNARGNQSFDVIDDARFSGTAGELRVYNNRANTVVAGDTDGDGRADFSFSLKNVADLMDGDLFI